MGIRVGSTTTINGMCNAPEVVYIRWMCWQYSALRYTRSMQWVCVLVTCAPSTLWGVCAEACELQWVDTRGYVYSTWACKTNRVDPLVLNRRNLLDRLVYFAGTWAGFLWEYINIRQIMEALQHWYSKSPQQILAANLYMKLYDKFRWCAQDMVDSYLWISCAG